VGFFIGEKFDYFFIYLLALCVFLGANPPIVIALAIYILALAAATKSKIPSY
jgi:hypothetical protein